MVQSHEWVCHRRDVSTRVLEYMIGGIIDMLQNLAQIISIPAIFLTVYAVLSLYMRITSKKEGKIWRRLVPLWALIIGTFIAIFAFTMFPEIMPAPSLFTSILLGGIAGLGATGLNQLMYQLFSAGEEEDAKAEEKKDEDTEQKS